MARVDVFADAVARMEQIGQRRPVLSDADPKLEERRVTVVPEILANSGGMIVSYFEWVHNRHGHAWTLSEVRDRLRQVLGDAIEVVWALSESRGLSLREAAYTHALLRLEEAAAAQGTRGYFIDGAAG